VDEQVLLRAIQRAIWPDDDPSAMRPRAARGPEGTEALGTG
jgi:hypothetical protein